MKAIVVNRTGGADVLESTQAPEPEPKANEVLVKLEFAGVNFIDIYHREGLYPKQLPFIPGLEGAGTVQTDGKIFKRGDRVAFASISGSYAEVISAPEEGLVKIPDCISTDVAAAAMLQGMTAHYLATSTFELRPGNRCLIHAAAGGVGLLLVQIAKMRGAFIIGTVSSDAKAELVREAGADAVIRYDKQPFDEAVLEITKGEKLQVVYDSVGQATFERSLRCLSRCGMMVLFGQSSGPVPPIDPGLLARMGSLFLTRPTLFDYISTNQQLLQRSGELFNWIEQGCLKIRIGLTLPLAKASEAHQALASRGTSGKLLLQICCAQS